MPDASFVIDIAAAMGGGEQTLAQLDALTSELMGAGKNAEFFQRAIVKVSADLDAAATAAVAANTALATGRDEYRALEAAALSAAKAAERAALKNDGVVPRDLAERAAETSKAVDDYAGILRGLEMDANDATREEKELAQTLANVKKLSGHVNQSIGDQSQQLEKLGGALGAVGGPLGAMGQAAIRPVQGFTKLAGSIGTAQAAAVLGGVAFGALVLAIVAVGAAAVVATAKVAAWAIGLADSARAADLSREALEAMHPELVELRDDVEALDRQTGLGGAALRGLAKSLNEAGASGDELAESLRVAALAERALGKEGSQAYIKLVKDAHDAERAAQEAAEKTGGIVPRELAEKVDEATNALRAFGDTAQSKLGGIVARQMLGLEVQGERLRSNIDGIFGGLDVEPALEGVQVLVGLFDKTTTAGQALKFLFEEIFQPIVDQAKNAAYVVEAFYLGFLIGAVKLYIALKPVIKTISEFFGFEDTALLDVLTGAKEAGEIVAYVFAGVAVVFGAVVGAIGLLVAAVLAIPAAWFAMQAAIQSAGEAIGVFVSEKFNAIVAFIKGIDFVQMGIDIMTGLANGIVNGAGAVVSAITGAVGGAINAAKSMLGIASPSRVFADMGDMTGAGFVEGVEAQNDNAQAAMTELVEPPDVVLSSPTDADRGGARAADAPAGAPPPAAAAAGPSVNFHGDVYFAGAKATQAEKQALAEELTRLLEGDALALGAGSESEAAA